MKSVRLRRVIPGWVTKNVRSAHWGPIRRESADGMEFGSAPVFRGYFLSELYELREALRLIGEPEKPKADGCAQINCLGMRFIGRERMIECFDLARQGGGDSSGLCHVSTARGQGTECWCSEVSSEPSSCPETWESAA